MTRHGTFEQGPIRPPSEASSLLLRVNRNCPWNRCTFCSIYKKEKFSLRPVDDVISEIDTVHRIICALDAGDPSGGQQKSLAHGDDHAFFAARSWHASGMKSIFLQDADSLTIPPENLIRILQQVKSRFPQVQRITSYARSASVERLSGATLKEVADAGLNRIHIGMESAADTVLELVQKGVTKATHIAAGLKVKQAGIELSEYFLIGLGGREFSEEHATESADALNQINPDFIRFRTLHLPDRVNLYAGVAGAKFQWAPDLVLAREVHTLISRLEGITSRIKSDHSYNLFQEIDGTLPGDRARLLAGLQSFIDMEPERRILFEVGKRSGHVLQLRDLDIPGRLEEVAEICRKSGITPDNADQRIHEIVQERMRRGLPY